MKVTFGAIRLHKFLQGKDEVRMYNIIPTIFLGLRNHPIEKDYIIGLDWLLWSIYIQFANPKNI